MAEIVVFAPEGAQIAVDATDLGTSPMASGARVPPGWHLVQVAESGHEPAESRVIARAGMRTTLTVTLAPTDQRIASWFLIGAGGVAALGAVATGAASFATDNVAEGMLNPATSAPDSGRENAYENATDTRDGLRIASGVAVGLGLGLFALGAALYAFDPPKHTDGRTALRLEPVVRF